MKVVIEHAALQAVIDWYRIEKPYPRSLVIGRLEELITDAKARRQDVVRLRDLADYTKDVRRQAFDDGYAAGLEYAEHALSSLRIERKANRVTWWKRGDAS